MDRVRTPRTASGARRAGRAEIPGASGIGAMTLLALERVGKRYTAGRLEQVVLDDVSLTLEEGELVAVWGMPRSGRSTLLRIAAGIEPPDTGVVRFQGRDLSNAGGAVLGHGIGYCRPAPRDREAAAVLDELMLGPRARGVHPFGRRRERTRSARAGRRGRLWHSPDQRARRRRGRARQPRSGTRTRPGPARDRRASHRCRFAPPRRPALAAALARRRGHRRPDDRRRVERVLRAPTVL